MTTLTPSETDLNLDHAGETHADHRMFGLATFLVADAMTFAGFFAAYLTFKAVNPLPAGAIYELELPLPILNTVLLLVSSFTFHRAGANLRRSMHQRCRLWLLISAALGFAFLVSQMVEYFTLPFGLTDNLYASTFYALTGFHGLHVTLGALMILIVWWQCRTPSGRITAQNHFPLEAAELYWHFVDGIWVILFVILYLL
ncbi:MAG: heme-copper oxidase subunit III [Synechococcaceae bacterium WB9_4xC_028]|jgi:cytochrome c oxidase subunit 3|uniref:cytochrome c oxidase subunit 3 n=1 Tax=unclassified Synechococcus TaxID=2626047 RepID=UPI00103A1717|nr:MULTISPECIES: cytochrome c oxidase subunit 3 [unclassified Synechococcus]NDD44334.1 heme-copper oxidase subunit III [Synechococcaceae bacterium WB9_4xB_025]NDD68266.1 heme-copper oxidase subunit III [Synechococcaceae bacterium WB9_4xC_028]TCD56270.1 heme-copper oxidase subunit III [Synechococcus sp. BS55D]TCD59514.1 heme-copper oxidase subunit III [Synechococcus sp. BS56D]